MRHVLAAVLWMMVAAMAATPGWTQYERRPDILYMDQPEGIDFAAYVAAWPELAPYVAQLKESPAYTVQANLRARADAKDVSDGELNLLAQLEWQHGEIDAAAATAARAVAMQPTQPLNAFQQAMVNFAHLERASGAWERWQWHRRTRDAYQRTLDLDSRNLSARYYLAYSYMNTPWFGGGDTKKALALSQGGIDLGQTGFYVVRADAHRLRGELDAAHADYDMAMRLRVFKFSAFVEAAQAELGRKDLDRAKRYLEYAVYCRPDATKGYEGLGDYYSATSDRKSALEAYQTAVDKDASNEAAKRKLAALDARR
jgi:tetratricopeptide (TPR) repeat protein